MSVEFQVSYTLDVIFYIKCLIDEEKRNLYDEDISRFLPMLGTVSDEYLEKLKKINQKNPDFIDYIVSLLIVNDHLHDWTTADLLDKRKRLVAMFKKSKQFVNSSKILKKFINSNFSKTIPLIKTIASDLERLQFKKFWLEEKLPFLRERSVENQLVLKNHSAHGEATIAKHINGWVKTKKMPENGQWYMLAYSGNEFKVLLDDFSVTSAITSADQLLDTVVSYVLKNNSYREFCKKLKPTPSLKAEFKGHEHYKSFKGISGYVDACLTMAIKVYLMTGYGKNNMVAGDDYPFATCLLAYLHENEKPADVAVGEYVTNMMKDFSR